MGAKRTTPTAVKERTMTAFSSWAFRLKQLLADVGVAIPLGHANELLAAGLKHNSYASLIQLESDALDQAQLIVFDEASVRVRARALDVDLDPARFLSDFLDILNDPDKEPSSDTNGIFARFGSARGPISNQSLTWSVGRVLEHCGHENLNPIAALLYDLNAKSYWSTSAEGTPCQVTLTSVRDAHVVTWFNWLEPVGTHACSDDAWSWSFGGHVRLAGYSDGYEVPVEGSIQINKLGRMLLGSAEITRLVQVGEAQIFDDDMDQGDVYGYDGSD